MAQVEISATINLTVAPFAGNNVYAENAMQRLRSRR
jgi:hypothetical protein